MGRPLSKKFIGNRNIGSTGTGDDNGIGGEGVGSYTVGNAGTGWTTAPTVSISGPALPTGVAAAGVPHFKALSFATTANGSGYKVGDILEVHTGIASIKARAPVATITVMTITLNNGGSNNDVGDEFEFRHASFSTALKVRVTAATTGTATRVEIVNGGIWTAAGTPPINTTVGGFNRVQTYGSIDMNGTNLQVNMTVWGVYAFGAVSVEGDYTVFPSTSGALDSITPATGAGATATITMGLLGITMTERGSGYVNAADAAVTFTPTNSAAVTAVLTTDSGSVGSATNQENAIQITAWVPATGTAGNISGNGTSAVVGDIVRQTGNGKYIVRTAQGVGRVKLVAGTPAVGEATIIATDSAGGTYYVTKISDRRCNIVKGNQSGTQFTTGTGAGITVSWTFNGTSGTKVFAEQPYLTANVNVKIANA
jgi:hypothetical protein